MGAVPKYEIDESEVESLSASLTEVGSISPSRPAVNLSPEFDAAGVSEMVTAFTTVFDASVTLDQTSRTNTQNLGLQIFNGVRGVGDWDTAASGSAQR